MVIFCWSNDIWNKTKQLLEEKVGSFQIIRNKYGKPYLKKSEVYFNISHCGDLGVSIIDKYECGIDVEKIREYSDLMALKFCSDNEYKFLSEVDNKDYYFTIIWTLKEAYLKCLGTGITVPMNSINFIKNGKLLLELGSLNFSILNRENYIVAICRKLGSYAGSSC